MTVTMPGSLTVAKDLVTPALRAAVGRLDGMVEVAAAYHFGWRDATGAPTSSVGGGKALRPALALLSAQAAGAAPERALPAAVAVELVHNFSLLHDDIMDGDTERRHRPTTWAVFGTGLATLTGDALLALASEVLLDDPSPSAVWAHRCLSGAAQRLIAGQADDLGFEHRNNVTLDACLAMASDKTGALISAPCALGAMLVDAPSAVVHSLAAFGESLGLAFQLVDDLLGIWGHPDATGKPVLSDLRTRKKSVPVVAALTSDTRAGAELRRLYQRPEPLSDDELVVAARLIDESGARVWTQHKALRQVAEAERHLDGTGAPARVLAEFRDITRLVLGRDS